MAGSLRLLLACLFLSCSMAGSTQTTPRIDEPPSAISFSDWKQESRTETSTEYSLTFHSAMTTSVPQNNIVPLRIFIPNNASGPVPVVLELHYLGARDLNVERALAGRLTSRGVAAIILTLPYHLSRTPPGKSSGELAISSEPADLIATMTQSVLDARRSLDFILSRPEFDHSRIGISGTSLGSIVSALVYALDPRIVDASFVLGGVDLAHIMWTSSRVVVQREALRKQGYTESSLRTALASIEPKTYLGKRTSGSSLVIGARYDTVMPPSDTEQLIAALKEPKVLWLETGHYGGIFAQRKLLTEVATFFGNEFASKPYIPPKYVFAPTLRLGFLASTGPSSAFDVGIGLDLFRSHSNHEFFGTFLVTPRGPQAYLGYQIDKGFSIGAIGSARRIGIGIMWSTVL